MNELNRTAIFVVIAAILSVITYATIPSAEQQSPADMVGKALLPDFDDPLEATSLEVVKFDKETASANTFKVAKIGDSWVIPSHNNYPADAEDQLADVAAEWIDLEVLGVATDPEESGIESDDIRGLHRLYGVVDPVGEDTGDAEAVGTRVVMRDKSDGELVNLIVGKEVEDQFGLRYVRLIGQDPVYTVKASTSKLSTKFEDWIEDDLLKLSSWDMRRVDIDDYSVDILQGFITPRGQISLEYNDTGDPRWNLAVDRVYAKEGWTDKGMAEDEELNTETLNDLKSALDDLKIVDVRRKPNGLSETLKSTGAIKLDREAEQSLSQAGFHVVPVADPNNPGQQYNDLRSNEGQISVGMKDGVSYILRFGQIAGMSADEEEPEKKGAEGDETEAAEDQEEESSGSKVNRYLFVMVQLDRSMIEEPEYEALPELPPTEEAKPEAPKADDDKEEKADDAKEEKPEEAKPEEAEGEEAKEDKPEEPEADSAKEEDGKPEGEEAEKKEEEPKPTREEIEKQREEIQKENDRKKEEYEEKIKEGEDKVKELNARFADWYYIINDGEYQKIHLSRDKIVKEKEEEEEGKSDDASAAAPTGPAIAPNSMGEFEGLKLEPPAKK
jgi:uncharacterized protein DUF4340